jgi:hypothetical protein
VDGGGDEEQRGADAERALDKPLLHGGVQGGTSFLFCVVVPELRSPGMRVACRNGACRAGAWMCCV